MCTYLLHGHNDSKPFNKHWQYGNKTFIIMVQGGQIQQIRTMEGEGDHVNITAVLFQKLKHITFPGSNLSILVQAYFRLKRDKFTVHSQAISLFSFPF